MQTYFISNGTIQEGPFTLEDLRNKRLTGDTPVWYEGLTQWTTASRVPEIAAVIVSQTPPPITRITPAITEMPSGKNS
ncbi:MAG: DUF4339 domain-containing protein, partial [Sphingobacteriales bacterium]